jgi:hypothetical protein
VTELREEPFEGDAHALLVWAYKNPDLPAAMRLQAATAAAPFEKPRLNAINATVDQHTTHTVAESYRTKLFSELDSIIAAAEAEEGSDAVETAGGLVNGRTTH